MKFSALLQEITPHRRTLIIILSLLLVQSGFSLTGPWIAGQLTGLVLKEEGIIFHSIPTIMFLWLLLVGLRSLVAYFSANLVGSTGSDMAANLRARTYKHLQSLPLSYFQQKRPGELLTLLSNNADEISNFVTGTLVQLLPLCVSFLGAFAIMAWLDPVIAIISAFLLPLYFFAMKIMGRKIRPLTATWIEARTAMISFVQENLGLFPAIKAFNREELEISRFSRKNERLCELTKRQIQVQSMLPPVISFLANVGLVALLWVGFSRVNSGYLEPSELVSLLLYIVVLTGPVSGLANVYGSIMHTRGAAERLLAFFSVDAEPRSEDLPELDCQNGAIEFRDLCFAYPDRKNTLDQFNLKIEAGETIGLTGPNGVGKTTLTHLLMRFIEPQSGAILIDGVNIQSVSARSVRSQIGLVAQNTLLLNGTITENIAFGNISASIEEVRNAATAACAHTFIEELPDQYDTVIGDQGLRLSGGQRQRLSLARTLLKNPRILILDEATAMFDPVGEQDFLKELRHLVQQRTVILITHRPASLELANRVISLGAN